MATFAQDVRYAVRLLLKHPGFSFITILVLALGIGATTAIFSIVDAVLLRSLPYPEPNRLVSVQLFWKQFNQRGTNVSAPDFHDWHDQATSFDGLAAYFGGQTSVRIGDTADYAGVIVASPDFFSVMGARTQLGRLLTAEEHQPGSQLAAVVSDGFWRSHLGADPGVIGRTLKFRERLYTIVGVMVPEFRFPANTDLWTPWWPIPETPSRSAHNYLAVARLKRGVTLAQAQADMDAIGARLEQTYPQSNESKGIVLDLLQDQMVRNTRTTLQLVFGVVITVLLIACANVSSLLLARASSRSRELGVRAAIGATRGRMVRQLVTESALLAIVSGGLGVLIAAWGLRGLIAIAPPGLPRIEEVAVDMRMLGFSLVVSVAASFVFGLAPALQTSRVDLNEVLKQAGRGAAARGMGRLRAALIVFETAAAVALVIAAALLVRSFAALAATDVGFRADHLLVAETTVPSADLDAAKRAIGFYRNLTPQLAAIPGVQAAAAVSSMPTRVRSNGGYSLEGGLTFAQLGVRSPQALFITITPNYFKTLQVPILKGRDFSDADADGAPLVCIINEAMAKAAFGSADPIGRRLMGGLDLATGPDKTRYMSIVGVVGNLRAADPALPPQPQLYHPYQQHPFPASAMTFLVRTPDDPLQVSHAVTQLIRAANPDVAIKINTMDATLGAAVAAPRFRTILLALFAGLALVLAMAGVYGIVSFTAAQRTSEMGLRMALGAQQSEIIRLTLASGLKLTAIGVVLGWAIAFALARVLSSMLYEVPVRDPVVFAVAPLVLVAVACLASMAPALRASRVDPSIALRVE